MDPIKAAAQYNAKLTGPNVLAYLLLALVPTMQPAYADSAVIAAALEASIKGILSIITVPAPIQVTDYILYYAFGRAILRRKRRYAGVPLGLEVGYLTTIYTARGLDAAALASIAALLV